jgi:nicotinate-nucleotide--dimethylbenzimidazole phosphoribosyltransferase
MVLSREVAALAAGVVEPDGTVMSEALATVRRGSRPAGTFGRLEQLWVRLCGIQSRCPATPFERRRLIAILADHPEHAGYAGDAAAAVLAGSSPIAALAERVGVGVRLVDVGLSADLTAAPDATSRRRVRPGAGAIAREPAQSAAEAVAAFEVGMAIADEEVDSGTDLLLLTSLGPAATAAATALVCAATGSEPVHTVGRAAADDATWIGRVAAVRDALRRSRVRSGALDPMELLTELGGPDLTAMTGLLVGAALRRTPVVLDGLAPTAAALVAARMSPRTVPYLVVSHRGADTAHAAAIDGLGVEALLDLGLASDRGEGALLAVPLLDAAVACLATAGVGE